MKRSRPHRWLIPLGAPLVLLGGCAATEPVESAAVSDALHTARPPLTLVMGDGFIVGDALGMSLMANQGVRLADVYEPFELD